MHAVQQMKCTKGPVGTLDCRMGEPQCTLSMSRRITIRHLYLSKIWGAGSRPSLAIRLPCDSRQHPKRLCSMVFFYIINLSSLKYQTLFFVFFIKRFYFIHFSRLNSISIILLWENTGSASKNYQIFKIWNHARES